MSEATTIYIDTQFVVGIRIILMLIRFYAMAGIFCKSFLSLFRDPINCFICYASREKIFTVASSWLKILVRHYSFTQRFAIYPRN